MIVSIVSEIGFKIAHSHAKSEGSGWLRCVAA